VGVAGNLKAVVTYQTREFGSFYQVEITDLDTDQTILTLRGDQDASGKIVLDTAEGPLPAGFSTVFELQQGLGLLTKTQDFGQPESTLFVCSR